MLRLCPLALVPLLACIPASAAVNVRVATHAGGPQIEVDGTPVPPRFFWGSMNSGRIALGPEWSEHSFDLAPGAIPTGGTLHFRFGPSAGEVWLADVRIQDAETGTDVLRAGSFAASEAFTEVWNQWPLGEANTVGAVEVVDGALHVTLSDPPGGVWPDFHLHSDQTLAFTEGRSYRCTFRAKATPARDLSVALYYVAGGAWSHIGGPPGPFLSQVALARDAGVDLVSFSAPNGWDPPEQPENWEPLDRLCRTIIAVNPDVLLVPRVSADAPNWWLDRHPEGRMVYDGETVLDHSCVADKAYRADVCAHLEKLCRHLTETFPDHFAGIHPCGQNTGEWFYQNSWERPLSGYDPATRDAFRLWLRDHGRPNAESAEPPTADERRAHPFGLLRDPAREALLIDFARYQQEEMADHVLAMASACRRGTGGTKLVVFFYGYLFEFPPIQCGAPTCGHYALSRVLGSPDIDILCSPISYTDRDWLGGAPSMTAAESVMRSGILWLNEDDSRTFLDTRAAEHVQEGGLVDLEQTRQVMLRNTAQAALRGFGTWWMDLPAQGWFNDARIWEEMTRLAPVDQAMLSRAKPFTPDIAAIVGEDSFCHLPGGSAVMARPLVYDARAALARSGAPYGQYLIEDAAAGNVPARLQFFLAAWALTPEERQALAEHRAPGTTRVWCYAPGYIRPDGGLDPSGIEEVSGFRAREVTLATPEATPTEAGRAVGLDKPWGPAAAIAPLFTVEAAPEETLAMYSDGSPAVAVRRSPRGVDVFVGVPALTPELVRALADLAGVHLFTRGAATVWAADGFLSLQAHEAGPLTINVGEPGPVYDALDGTPLGEGPEVTLDLKQGETRVLRYGAPRSGGEG